MGLALEVGILADLDEHDPEGATFYRERFATIAELLSGHGIAAHVEPADCAVWSGEMFGYSGLHLLRRLAAHLDSGAPLPPPGDPHAGEDRLVAAYTDAFLGRRSGLLQKLLGGAPTFERAFDHLIIHSDAEGFYLPVTMAGVLVTDDSAVAGGMLGSSLALRSELDGLAAALGIPDHITGQSEDLWEAADAQGAGDARWERYGIESFCCTVLRDACRHSIDTGAAIVFC